MKASELIEELKHKIDEYGDLNVASLFSEGSLISINIYQCLRTIYLNLMKISLMLIQ